MVVYSYLIYIVISLILTVWVGRTLNKNGRLFLVENFKGNEALADSVNHLLLVGFYLVNLGFVLLALQYGNKPTNTQQVIEFLSLKIGLVVVVLGFMHFYNMHALVKYRGLKIFNLPETKAPENKA